MHPLMYINVELQRWHMWGWGIDSPIYICQNILVRGDSFMLWA